MRYLLLIALCIIGCESQTNTPLSVPPKVEEDTLEIMPLKVGNSWTYQYQRFDSLGAVIENKQLTDTVLFDTKYKEEPFYHVGGRFYANRPDGLWQFDNFHLRHLLKYPCTVGDRFRSDTMSLEVVSGGWYEYFPTVGEVTVTYANSKIVALDTIFTCIEYQTDYSFLPPREGPSHRAIMYYSPGVGLVRRDYFIYIDGDYRQLANRWLLISKVIK